MKRIEEIHRDQIEQSIFPTVKSIFPVVVGNRELRLDDITLTNKLSSEDIPGQKSALELGKTWGEALRGTLVLKEDGKIKEKKTVTLATIPQITLSDFIVKGTPYQVFNQARLKPGAYTVKQDNDEIVTKFIFLPEAKVPHFNIVVDDGILNLNVQNKNISLFNVLRVMGVNDADIKKSWGSDIFELNKSKREKRLDSSLGSLYESLFRTKIGDTLPETAQTEILNKLKEISIDEGVTERTLGLKGVSALSPDVLLRASNKLLNVIHGKESFDEKDDVINKVFYNPMDLLDDRIKRLTTKIKRDLTTHLRTRGEIESIVPFKTFNSPVESFFTQTDLSGVSDSANPIGTLEAENKLSFLGEGAISDMRAAPEVSRRVHSSFLGLIDPILTPQSTKAGLIHHLASGTTIHNKQLFKAVEEKNGEIKTIPLDEFYASIIGIEKKPVKGKIEALHKGKKIKTTPDQADYFLSNPIKFFSPSMNLMPFLNYNEGNRMLVASKLLGQALPLKHREAPLIEKVDKDGYNLDKEFALLPDSPVDGVVDQVTPDLITIKDRKGKKHSVGIYNKYPLMGNAYLHNEPVVKKGDKVELGQPIVESNYSKDGRLALGINLVTALMPWKGYNFNDAVVISESAAEKLTSEHLHKITIPKEENNIFNLKKYNAYVPYSLTKEQMLLYDDEGIIREGAEVSSNDILAARLKKTVILPDELELGKLSKSLVSPIRSDEVTFDVDFPGVVEKVIKTPSYISIYIKTNEPARLGDKIAGTANKSIISAILPDNEMPRTKDGQSVEVLVNPLSVPSRIIPGQILEIATNKLARKRGEKIQIENFTTGYLETILKALKKEGISDKEKLYLPYTNEYTDREVLVGPQYFLKIRHQVGTKFSAREMGSSYDVQMQPLSGGEGQSMALDHLTSYSMLSHGAKHNLGEMMAYKSERLPEFWRAIETGSPLPKPKPSFATNKFVNMLHGLGVNVIQNDNQYHLAPLTDKEIVATSKGLIEHPERILKGYKMEAEKDGLLDTWITGGLKGENFNHIKLETPIPNPVFRSAIQSLTGIKGKEYNDLIQGKIKIEGLTAGEAIEGKLKKIDVDNDLQDALKEIKTASISQVDELNKKIKYLSALKKLDMKPADAYILHNLPVVPPVFRQVYPLPGGNIYLNDLNLAYKNIGLANLKIKELRDKLPPEELSELNYRLYRGVEALMGTTGSEPLGFMKYRGIMDILAGPTPKEGLIHDSLIRKRMDLSGKGTVTADPTKRVDEVGLPEDMAWNLYTPFVVKRLRGMGYSSLEAKEKIKSRDETAKQSLMNEMAVHPVLLNRAPSLHRYNIMAFLPKLTPGKHIEFPHLPMMGFNMDFDGDTALVHIPVTQQAIKESFNMLPSKHLRKAGTDQLLLYPQQESLLGLHYLSKDKKGREEIGQILGINIKEPLTKKTLLEILDKQVDSKNYAKTVDKLKDLGYAHITRMGYSIGLEDIYQPMKEKSDILKGFDPHAPMETIHKSDAVIKKYFKDTPLYDSVLSGARANKSDIRKILFSPITTADHNHQIHEEPVTHSYSEGLSLGEYLDTSYDVRGAVLGRSREVIEPGWMNKKILSSTADVIITDKEIDDPGIEFSVNHSDITDRFTAQPISLKGSLIPRNTLITDDLISSLKKNRIDNIYVRSPLSVESNVLIPQKSFGLNEFGNLPEPGTNIGIIAGQAMSEPITQMTLSKFHSSGVSENEHQGGFMGLQTLLDLPKNLAGKAELAPFKGEVKKIEKKDFGYKFNIDGKDVEVFSQNLPAIKIGQKVNVGDQLTLGKIDPTELINLKGLSETQKFITDRLEKIYNDDGIPIKRRYLETVIQKITDSGKVVDSGDSDFIPGDKLPITVMNRLNKDLKNKITFTPELKGVNAFPLLSEDWLGRLNFGHLKRTISEGASRGWKSNSKSSHPIPKMIFGTDLFDVDEV